MQDYRVEDPGPADAGASERERRLAEPMDRIVSNDALQEAVENDLFQPERQGLSERYRLPSDFVAESPREREPGQGPDFRVVGSAVLTGNSFALLQSDDDPPYAVRVGETFRGYRVTTVDSEWVTVTGSAGQVTIPVQAAVVASGNGNGGRDQRSRNQNQNQNDERAIRQRLEEAQRAIQQLRQLGAAGGLGGARLQVPGGAASFQVGPDGQIQVVPGPQGQIIIGPGGQPRVVPGAAAPQARRRGGGGGE
jgi:hypothetical protein